MSQFCISCGIENQDEAKFCKSCGQPLITEETKKFKQEEQERAEQEKYSSIGGWLIFFAIILVLGNITWLGYIVKTYAGDEFTNTIESLYMQGYTEQVSYLNMLVSVELIGYFSLLLFTINFFMKSPITKHLMIIYSIVMIVSAPISISLLYKINPDMSQYTAEIGKMIGSTFWIIVWMFYFIFSKRVKKTFIAKDGNEPENSLIVTIIFALLIPAYFGYKHYSTVSSLKSISNDSYALTQKAIGLYEDKKYQEAIPYFSKASELGSPKAMAFLCQAYMFGDGVEKNLYTAKNWCQESFNNTNEVELQKIIAEYLGNIYFEQDNFKDAKTWYTKSMDTLSTTEDKAKFAHRIAEKYFDAKHFTTSAYWYQQAVDLGDKSAKFRLAYSYSERKQYDLAIKYYKEYIKETEWEGAMGNLANIYRKLKNYKSAIYWYQKAIAKGNKDVYFSYAYSYDELGNKSKAIEWYKKAATENNDATAMYNLGIIYENQANYSDAKYWYQKAANNGDRDANKQIQNLYTNGHLSYY